MPTTPEKSLLAPAVETVQHNLAAATTKAEEPELAAGRACLQACLPIAERGLPMRREWLAAPVTPRPERDEDFPVWPDVASLRTAANAQRLTADISDVIAEPFRRSRETVNGFCDEIPRAEAAVNAIPKLSLKDVERPPQWRNTPFWPAMGGVARLRQDLCNMGMGRDRLDDAARALAASLEALLRWSRGQKERGVREAAMTRQPDPEANTETVLSIKPFRGMAHGHD